MLYLDAVVDWATQPIYNGTPQETEAWLKEHPEITTEKGNYVYIGQFHRLVSIEEYLGK